MADQVADRPAPTPSQTVQEALDEIAEALHEIETLLANLREVCESMATSTMPSVQPRR